MPKLKGINKT